MEAERSNSRSVKRKPLSDRTNIIPSSTVLKLSSPHLFTKSSNPNSIPLQIPKPFNSSSKPCKQSTNSSKSYSSVGSTNNSTTQNDQNSTRVPKTHPSTPTTKPIPHFESTNPGNENDEIIEPLIVCCRKPSTEKTGIKGDNTVAVPFSYSHLEEKNPFEKTKDKGKAVVVPFNVPNVGITKDKQKAIALPLDRSPLSKTKDKGKAIDVPFSVPTFGKTKDLEKIANGKAIDKTFSSHSVVKRNDKAIKVAMPPHHLTLEKGNDRGRGVSAGFSSSPVTRTRNIWNEHNDAEDNGLPEFQTDPHLKHKKKRRTHDAPTFELPKEFVEKQRVYFKEIDEFELPVEEASDDE